MTCFGQRNTDGVVLYWFSSESESLCVEGTGIWRLFVKQHYLCKSDQCTTYTCILHIQKQLSPVYITCQDAVFIYRGPCRKERVGKPNLVFKMGG